MSNCIIPFSSIPSVNFSYISPSTVQPVREKGVSSFRTVRRDCMTTTLHRDQANMIPVFNHASNITIKFPFAPIVCNRPLKTFHPSFCSQKWNRSISVSTHLSHRYPIILIQKYTDTIRKSDKYAITTNIFQSGLFSKNLGKSSAIFFFAPSGPSL